MFTASATSFTDPDTKVYVADQVVLESVAATEEPPPSALKSTLTEAEPEVMVVSVPAFQLAVTVEPIFATPLVPGLAVTKNEIPAAVRAGATLSIVTDGE
jgi:hypothetical protein